MTSRFFRAPIPWAEYTRWLDLTPPPNVDPPEPKWNIAPMSLVPVIRPRDHGEPGLDLTLKLWSLVPQWWREPLAEKKWTSFNAKAEDIGQSATFRGAYRYRRCLIPASGFYVWSGPEGRRVPYGIGIRDVPWFCMGGVWERWGFDGAEVDTFAIVTIRANDCVGAHTERMPLILAPDDWEEWLDVSRPAARTLLDPWPAERMEDWPAHPAVGNVRQQGMEMVGQRGGSI